MTSRSTTAARPARNSRILKQRIQRFLVAPQYGPEVTRVVAFLSDLGRVAVFGGALRDLALHGTAARPADIDLVVEGDSDRELSRFLAPYAPVRNRFGGFRFRTERWSFDVWRVEDTWAVREGLVKARALDDLVQTTFFDWDALLYVQRSGTIAALPGYFDRLASLVINVNLQENPNPLGNLVRTLRVLALGRAFLGERLMAYAWDQLGHVPDREILGSEAASFRTTCLSEALLSNVRERLAGAMHRGDAVFSLTRPRQLEFAGVERALG